MQSSDAQHRTHDIKCSKSAFEHAVDKRAHVHVHTSDNSKICAHMISTNWSKTQFTEGWGMHSEALRAMRSEQETLKQSTSSMCTVRWHCHKGRCNCRRQENLSLQPIQQYKHSKLPQQLHHTPNHKVHYLLCCMWCHVVHVIAEASQLGSPRRCEYRRL